MIKRIKIILSVLLFVVAFSYIKVNAGECGGGKYEYLYRECTYEYKTMVFESGQYSPQYQGHEVIFKVLADGKGGYSIIDKGVNRYNDQFSNINFNIGGFTSSDSGGLNGLFKYGEEFSCPQYIYFGKTPGNVLDLSTSHGFEQHYDSKTNSFNYSEIGRLERNGHSCNNNKPFKAETPVEKDACRLEVYMWEAFGTNEYDYHEGYQAKAVKIDAKFVSGQWLFYKDGQQITKVDIGNHSYDLKTASIESVKNGTESCSKLKIICITNQCTLTNAIPDDKVETSDRTGTSDHRGDEYLDDMGDIFGNVDDPGTCDTLLDADAKELIITIFNWIRIITPILLVLLGALDFGKAVLASDEKQMAAATKNFITRCVIALAIFFVPLIIYYFMDIIMKSTGIVDNAGNICKFL